MNMGSPNGTVWPTVAEGGGGVRSTVDMQDNITCKEGRDTADKSVLDNRSKTKLEKGDEYPGKKVQQKLVNLSQKKRER